MKCEPTAFAYARQRFQSETRLACMLRFLTGRPLTDIGYRMSDPAFGVTQFCAVTPFRKSVIGGRSAAVQ